MVKLYDKASGAPLGEITDAQLQFLRDQLEEESLEDVDYYLNEATLDMFAARGADSELLELVRQALGTREGIEIAWSQD
jgi:processive 1,2-diacylglycerol beta-glucosyltransferase